MGFPVGSVVKNLPANAGDVGLISGLGRSPWRRKWQLTLVFLPGKSYEQRSLPGCSLWGHKRVRHNLVGSDLAAAAFPGGASGKEPICQFRRHRRYEFGFWVRKIP